MLDVILVAVIIAAAVGFLAWNFSGSAPKPTKVLTTRKGGAACR